MSNAPASPLEDVRRQIAADLAATQGPWRQKSPALRAAVLVVPAVVVVVVAFMVLTPVRGVSAPVVVAGLASLLALIGVALAPSRPALGERVSQAATVVAIAAFVAEVLRVDDGAASSPWACFGTTIVVAAAAAAVIAAGLFWSRLPLRLWHKVGLGVASTLGACAAIWHHCPSTEMAHVLVGHTVGPAALMAVVVVVIGGLRRGSAS